MRAGSWTSMLHLLRRHGDADRAAGRVDGGQPAARRWTGRPGIRRRGRDRASSRPSWRASSAAGRWNSAARSVNRPSGGGQPAAVTAFGEIQRSGGVDVDRDRRGGAAAARAARLARKAAIWRAACRPDSAATSAVSAACTRLPAANTPGADVARPVSTAGPRVPGVEREARRPRQHVVGDPVAGEHEPVARRPSAACPPCRVRRVSTPASRPPRRSPGSRRSTSRPGRASAARRRAGRRRSSGAARWSVTRAITRAPACARVTAAEKLTCSAPTTSARPVSRSPPR